MKAITLWQPWASLLACGAKHYETRSWATNYRGPIAIHAAALDPKVALNKVFPLGKWPYAPDYSARNEFSIAVGFAFEDYAEIEDVLEFVEALPRGGIIATAELVECWRIVYHPGADISHAQHIPVGAELDVPKQHPRFGDVIIPTERELMFGDWYPGRYAWEFANMTMLPEPIPAKGRQRLWEWEGTT